ncbi:MAG: tetratricopeptide repeat protein, partial [Pseudomonadota bacterium]
MRPRARFFGFLAVLGALAVPGIAPAQFNPQGRTKKPPARPPAATPKKPAAAPSAAGDQAAPNTEALIARYTGIALAQPGAEFPVQRLAELYRSRDGKLDALIEDLRRRVDAGGPTRLAALLALARAYKADGNFDQAIATYERALAESPGAVVAELAVAHLFAERGERDKARVRFESALPRIKEAAEREQVLRTLRTLALDAGDVAAAKRHHEQLVAAQKGSFFVRAELGRELYQRGMYDAAVEELAALVKAAAGDNRVLA